MKRILALGVVALLIAIAGTVWACRRHRVDPQMQKVMKLQAKAFDQKIPQDQRLAMGSQIRTEVEKLAPEQRRQFFSQMMGGFQRIINERAAAYCKLPPDQRTAFLDQQIAEMQKFQQAMQSQRPAGQPQNGGNAQNSGNAQNGNGPIGPGGPGKFDQQARNQFRNQMLDSSTPEQRAQLGAFFQAFGQRCQERGLPPPGFGRR
jgi:hypothetical protein